MANETQAQIGYASLLQLGNGASPQVFTTIAEVKTISPFGFNNAQLDATHMLSPNSYMERVAGMKDTDELTVVCNMTRDNAIQIKTFQDAGTVRYFQLNFPSTLPDYDFAAVPTGFHIISIEPNAILEVEFKLRISGAITGS